jgi:hypothetical protein
MIPSQCHLWQKENLSSDDLDLEKVMEFYNRVHAWRFLMRCRGCGQLYVDDNSEIIRGKKDLIFTTLYPVSEIELKEIDFSQSTPENIDNFLPVLIESPVGGFSWIK